MVSLLDEEYKTVLPKAYTNKHKHFILKHHPDIVTQGNYVMRKAKLEFYFIYS